MIKYKELKYLLKYFIKKKSNKFIQTGFKLGIKIY